MICRMGRAQRNPSSWPVIARGMMGFAALYPSYIGVESSRGWRLRLGRSTCRAATDRADDRFGQLRFRERLGPVGLGALAHAPDAVGVLVLVGDQAHGGVLRARLAGDRTGGLAHVGGGLPPSHRVRGGPLALGGPEAG